jgi:hypothetical protein
MKTYPISIRKKQKEKDQILTILRNDKCCPNLINTVLKKPEHLSHNPHPSKEMGHFHIYWTTY